MTNEMTRKDFLQTLAGIAAAAAVPTFSSCSAAPKSQIKLGVCTYSYNGDVQQGRMTLEDCIADIADLGGEGIEFMPEALMPDYPNPTDKWIAYWFGLMDKCKIKPVCLTGFIDTRLYKSRALTVQEMAGLMERDFKIANRMGLKVYRGLGSSWDHATQMPPGSVWAKAGISQFDVYDKILPLLEKYDVRIAEEVHSPEQLNSEWMRKTMDYILKTKTKYIGFCPDMGIFQDRMRRNTVPNLIAQGGRQNIVEFIIKNFEDNVPQEQILAEVVKMGGNQVEQRYAGPSGIYHGSYNKANRNNPQDYLKFVPYTYHVHGKFWEMTEDLKEYCIPYEKVIPVLVQGGYNGYICSEYEGSREVFQAPIQLRRQHCMLRGLLAQA